MLVVSEQGYIKGDVSVPYAVINGTIKGNVYASEKLELLKPTVRARIALRIEDDGKGFDVDNRMAEALEEKRMGLRSMQERVNLLNGKMKLQSKRGQGTKVIIKLPFVR